jgi:hypothetical protein
MTQGFGEWLEELRDARRDWVAASRRNKFDRGIWNATVAKYADPSHFVLELLQNAEDAGATRIQLRLEPAAIEFEHDGHPFDRGDIEGVTGLGNSTKLDQAKKIGCFGIGFKSVHVVTHRPEVHFAIEGRRLALAIDDLVVPELIDTPVEGDATVIRLPLDPERAADVLRQVRAALDANAGRSLLFLDSVRELRWSAPDASGSCQVEDSGPIRTLRVRRDGDALPADRFVMLSRSLRKDGDERDFSVKVALPLNAGGEVFPEPQPTKLNVFFETEDPTGLRFRVHGPFQLTDNRANLKRDDPWNATLIAEIGTLLASELPALRDRGLLTRSLLETLPNSGDVLADGWEGVRSQLVEAFQSAPLMPVAEGGHVVVAKAVRGPADVRDAFGDDGLAIFARREGVRWAAAGLRGRADTFIATVGVQEFGPAEALAAFTNALQPQILRTGQSAAAAWFDALPDERLQRLYLVVDAATKGQRRAALAYVPFVRVEGGGAVTPGKARFAPKGALAELDGEARAIPLVRAALLRPGRGRGPEVEHFLRRCGVQDVAEADFLRTLLAEQYAPGVNEPNQEQHLRHLRRFVSHHAETGDASLLKGVALFRVEGGEGYAPAESVYMGQPYSSAGLERIYGGRVAGRNRRPLWSGYSRIGRQKELRAMLVAAGVEASLSVVRASPSGNPRYGSLITGFGSTRNTGTGVSDDYTVPQLAGLLALKDPEVSRMVWAAVTAAGPHVMHARWSPNASRDPKTAPSQLACLLATAAWLPDKEGAFRTPRAMTATDLAPGFPMQSAAAWLPSIGFGADQREQSEQGQARRRAAEAIGLPGDLADRILGLSVEARAALAGEMILRIETGAFQPPEFPERDAPNPQRRAERVAERARSAPAKVFEMRERSVRTSDIDARAMARAFLRDQYVNDAGQMVCQCCHLEMPFRLDDGAYYFEAVAMVRSIPVELAEHFLALCPTCSAKWQHARATEDATLISAVLDGSEPAAEVTLAGELVVVRFTAVHIGDLRIAIREVMGDAEPPARDTAC